MFSGSYKDGKRNGIGKLIFSNGDIYDGKWKDDQRHGVGKQTYKNGTVYDGKWKNDKRHGPGKQIFPDNRVFVGEWVDDEILQKLKDDQIFCPGKLTYNDGSVHTLMVEQWRLL